MSLRRSPLPIRETDRIAAAAGLAYLAFLTDDRDLARDPARVAQIRAESDLAGFHFLDTGAVEGFTTPDAQQRAYETLKSLFPGKLVLYPTRLDPIAWESGYLDGYFRPEFTDLVTPYFYPVGTTILGQAREEDAWDERLAGLLLALAPRIPGGRWRGRREHRAGVAFVRALAEGGALLRVEGGDSRPARSLRKSWKSRVRALVRALAEARRACARRSRATASLSRILREVVAGLADVAERLADQLAAVDDAVLRQDELPLAGEAELLEGAALAPAARCTRSAGG